MKLKNLKRIPFEIAEALISKEEWKKESREKFLKLLINDTSSALEVKTSDVSVDYLIEKNYIGFYPATEAGIKDNDRNTFLIINLEDFNLQNADNNINVTGAIYITTDKSHCLLDNKKLRLLELIDVIDTLLDNQKLSSAGKISLTSANYVVFSDFRSGYRINFRCSDQQTRKAEL